MHRRPGASTHAYGSDPIIVAYGVGVDSTAMLIGLRDRGVEPDLILFADTGSEKPETGSVDYTWKNPHGSGDEGARAPTVAAQ